MLYAGLDLSRQRLDVHVLDEEGRTVEVMAVHPDADALRTLASRVLRHGQEVSAAIESMTGSRFVHDTLERLGWEVAIADPVKAKGLAPLAAKTDKIDARVLAELARRDLVPEIWLPDPGVRAERERARFRLHLVHHRSALKCRIHATLMTFGHTVPVTDLFGTSLSRRTRSAECPSRSFSIGSLNHQRSAEHCASSRNSSIVSPVAVGARRSTPALQSSMSIPCKESSFEGNRLYGPAPVHDQRCPAA